VLCVAGSDVPIEARLVDGWHRLFAGRICGVRGLRCEVIEENQEVVEMPGYIEQGSVTEGSVLLSGWCVAPDEVTVVELRAGAEMLARSPMSLRPDVRAHFPHVLHAGTSGFFIDLRVPAEALEGGPLTLLALCDWLPIGRMMLRKQRTASGVITIERVAQPPSLPTAQGVAEMNRQLLETPAPVSTQISQNDRTFTGDIAHHFAVGRSALNSIRLAMLACGKGSAARILDLSCGYGRVLRWLRAAFPEAGITACDLRQAALDFCADTFRAERAYLTPDTAKLPVGAKYDLIWCGTWMSHLPEGRWRGFLAQFRQLLAPRGLAVFTTHGRHARDRMLGGSETYGIHHLQIADLIESHDRTGFGHAPYPDESGFGLTISSPAWVCARIAELKTLDLVSYTERGWDRHQDVVACMRR
jgi:SAM-dependent methyltransferase